MIDLSGIHHGRQAALENASKLFFFFFFADDVAARWDAAHCAQCDNSTVTAGCRPRCSIQAPTASWKGHSRFEVKARLGEGGASRSPSAGPNWCFRCSLNASSRKRQVESGVNYSEGRGEKAPLKVKITFLVVAF